MAKPLDLEICILAGGLSSRMGRDKCRLRVGGRTLLGHVRNNAAQLGLPTRVVSKDLVRRCGPLGGIFTALKTTSRSAVLFLACDMPFMSAAVLSSFLGKFDGKRAVFAVAKHGPGFPLILQTSLLPTVEELIASDSFSLHNLADITRAQLVRVAARALLNINTAEDLIFAKKRLISAQEQLVKKR